MPTRKRLLNKRPSAKMLLLLAVVLVGAGLLGKTILNHGNKPIPNTGTVSKLKTNPSVNLSPATAAEKQEAEAHKADAGAQTSNNTATTASGKKDVTPFITSVDETRGVKSYVPGIIEDGGTCTALFAQGGSTVTKTSQGFANASNTTCAPMPFARSDFPNSGTWSVVVSYSSSSAEGKSQPLNIEVK